MKKGKSKPEQVEEAKKKEVALTGDPKDFSEMPPLMPRNEPSPLPPNKPEAVEMVAKEEMEDVVENEAEYTGYQPEDIVEKTGEEVEDDEDEPDLSENGEKKRRRHGGRETFSLKDQLVVLEVVALNNFFAAPFGKTAQWEKKCKDELKKRGIEWGSQKLRRFVKQHVEEYNSYVSKGVPTGNVAEWIDPCREHLQKLSSSFASKEVKKVIFPGLILNLPENEGKEKAFE